MTSKLLAAVTASNFDVKAKIAQLFIYPIKSCGAIELKEAVLTETGLDLDRAWMLVDEAGDFVTQRELPRMTLIQPLLNTYDLIVKAPGMAPLHVPIYPTEEELGADVNVKVWEYTAKAFDMGDDAADWFSTFLKKTVRLVRFDPEQARLSDLTWTDGLEGKNGFDDGFAILVTSAASLKTLNDKLEAAREQPVTMQRFRPNIVLTGVEAHDEDRLDTLHIATKEGDVQLKHVKPCVRCTIPTVDPKTGKTNPAVSDTLQTYRQNPQMDNGVTFGMNAIILKGEGATLRVGQTVGANYLFG